MRILYNILLVSPCLLTRIQECIHTQNRKTIGIAMLRVDKFLYDEYE